MTYDRNTTVDNDGFDCSLTITLRKRGSAETDRLVRIAVEDIPDFISAVTRHGMYALTEAASRLEVGHCETCGNIGLVDGPGPGNRTQQVYCPDCKDRTPSKPFANAPQIARKVVPS